MPAESTRPTAAHRSTGALAVGAPEPDADASRFTLRTAVTAAHD